MIIEPSPSPKGIEDSSSVHRISSRTFDSPPAYYQPGDEALASSSTRQADVESIAPTTNAGSDSETVRSTDELIDKAGRQKKRRRRRIACFVIALVVYSVVLITIVVEVRSLLSITFLKKNALVYRTGNLSIETVEETMEGIGVYTTCTTTMDDSHPPQWD